MVFDRVISTSFKDLGDVSPLRTVDPVVEIEEPLFLFAPLVFFDVWVQVVMPSLINV
jgi:hypothetical protein